MAKMVWKSNVDLLNDVKMLKKEQLSESCQKNIIDGFDTVISEVNYRFRYNVDNQQNFSDTMRLFENNMINSIGWNAYLDNDKKRIQLNKEEFTKVYLEGVKHKNNCLTMLNDYLYPLVDSAKNKDELDLIYWGQGIHADDIVIDDTKTIEKKTNKLEVDNARNANGILELTNLILMGGG